jgi:hypothetical protein
VKEFEKPGNKAKRKVSECIVKHTKQSYCAKHAKQHKHAKCTKQCKQHLTKHHPHLAKHHRLVVVACDMDRMKKEDEDKRKRQSVRQWESKKITELTDPNQFPTLVAKNTCITSDKDIKAVTRERAKLSKQVKSVALLDVVHHNDTTTSLVEVLCSAKQSGFKERARRSRWMERSLESMRRFKKEDALVDENDDDDDNDETACTNDDAARLITWTPFSTFGAKILLSQ